MSDETVIDGNAGDIYEEMNEDNNSFPELDVLKKFSKDEVAIKWHEVYLERYVKGDEARKNGDHKSSIGHYNKAKALIDYVEAIGIEDELISIRRVYLHFADIQSHTSLQKDSEGVMREFHNFKETLYKFLKKIIGEDDSAKYLLEEMKREYKKNHCLEADYLLSVIKIYFQNRKDELEPEVIESVWKFAVCLSRLTAAIHDFYMLSTDLMDEGRNNHIVCKDAAAVAVDAMKMLPEGYLPDDYADEDDEDKYHKNVLFIFRDQTETWLDVYGYILEMENEHIMESDSPADMTEEQDKEHLVRVSALRSRAEKVLVSHRSGEKVHPNDVEFALEIMAYTTLENLIRGRITYEDAIDEWKSMVNESCDLGFKRIQTLAYIFMSRAAIRFEQLADAQDACTEIGELRGHADEYSKDPDHIFDKWFNLISAEIKFMKMKEEERSVNQERDSTGFEAMKILKRDSGNISKLSSLRDIEEIDEIFEGYKLDSDVQRPELSNKPLDAKIYYVLGKAAFAKVEILARGYRIAKDAKREFEKGPELLKSFTDCQTYLCEAYNLLKDMGYQGTALFKKIVKKDEALNSFNDDLLNDFKKSDDKEKEPEEEFDMAEIAQDYRIEKWTSMVYKILRNQELSQSDDYEYVLNRAIGESLNSIIGSVTKTFLVEETDDSLQIAGDLKIGDNEMIENSIKRYKEGEDLTSYYHTKKGKLHKVVSIDPSKGKYLVMEMKTKINVYSSGLVREMMEGVRYLFNTKDLSKQLDALDNDTPEYKSKRLEVLEETNELFRYLFRRHEPTERHSAASGAILREVAQALNEEYGMSIDLDMVEYAGRLHDVGKLFLNPKLLLDVPRKYQSFERNEVEKHATEGVELLRGILGFKHFKDLIALVGSHHVRYGHKRGYPVAAPGNKIKNVLELFASDDCDHKLVNVTAEEMKYIQTELSEEFALMARMMNPIDQIQAVRSSDRKYRPQGAMPLKVLEKYLLNQNIAADFDPEVIKILYDLFRNGYLGDKIAYTDEEREQLKEFKIDCEIYSAGDVLSFVIRNRGKLERECSINIDPLMGKLLASMNYGMSFTERTIGELLYANYVELAEGDEVAGKALFDTKSPAFFKGLSGTVSME